jgi:hypothetical protein
MANPFRGSVAAKGLTMVRAMAADLWREGELRELKRAQTEQRWNRVVTVDHGFT